MQGTLLREMRVTQRYSCDLGKQIHFNGGCAGEVPSMQFHYMYCSSIYTINVLEWHTFMGWGCQGGHISEMECICHY